MGNRIEERYFGTNGEPIKESTGWCAKAVYQCDFRGFLEKEVRYNENDEPYGTEEDPVNCIDYLRDNRGFNTGKIYYDKKGNVISQTKCFVYIKDIVPGTSAETAGIMPVDFILHYGRWDYLYDSEFDDAIHDLLTIATVQHSEDDVLILCWIQDDGSCMFYQVSDLSDYIGFSITFDQAYTSSLEFLMTAYQ